MSLRERNRRRAMRDTQRVALPMLVERGFDAVTTEEIAAAAGVATSTVFRHFGTKEQIVVWDEHDPVVEAAITSNLAAGRAPLHATRDAFVHALAPAYLADLDFQLQRVRYIYATEALHAAAVEADFTARAELGDGFAQVLSRSNRDAAPLLAGAALLALDVAVDEWQRSDRPERLADMIERAFDRLDHLAEIS